MNFHAKHVTGASSVSPQTIVQMKYDEAAGDLNRTADLVLEAVRGTPLADIFIRYAARTMAGAIGTSERRDIVREMTAPVAASRSQPFTINKGMADAQRRATRRGANYISALYDLKFKVDGRDTRLGDMTGTQARAIGAPLLEAGTKTVQTARFLLAIADLAGSRKVQEAVTSEKLEALHADKIPA